MEWTRDDAWILLSMGGRGPLRPRATRGTAGYLAHDLPTDEQFSASIAKLVGSGLLAFRHGCLYMTMAAFELADSAFKVPGSGWDAGGKIDVALTRLAALVCHTVDPPEGSESWFEVLATPRRPGWRRFGFRTTGRGRWRTT